MWRRRKIIKKRKKSYKENKDNMQVPTQKKNRGGHHISAACLTCSVSTTHKSMIKAVCRKGKLYLAIHLHFNLIKR